MQGIRVWSLVRELKSHRPRSYEPEHAIACAPQPKIPHNTIKIQCSQINKYIKKNNNLKKYIIYKKHIVKQKKTPISTLGSWTTSYLFSHTFFFNWRPITLQYCSGFCHTFTWISHGCTCVPNSEPPPTLIPSYPSGSSQCTSPVSCIEPGLAICFKYDNIHVSMLFSQIIPPSSSPTESKSLLFISVSLLLSRI